MRYPPFVSPGKRAVAPEIEERDELPSINDFVDELPPIEDFLHGHDAGEGDPVEVYGAPAAAAPAPAAGAEGWAQGEWQSYDWSSLSSLNRQNVGRPTAEESWGDSEWPGEDDQQPARDPSITPAADEIADALDGIARRIRSGELVIDNLHGTPPEAAMAAALAVLLRMRG